MRRLHIHLLVGALLAMLVVAHEGMAQVMINMPSPPKKSHTGAPEGGSAASTYAASTQGTAYPSANESVTVGDVALERYANARYYAYDTYFSDGSYYSNGIRVYSYPRYFPQYIWGPWWGGGWGWGWWGGWGGCHM